MANQNPSSQQQILGAVAKPQLKDVLDRTKQEIYSTLNCANVGTITAYNPTTNTASVNLAISKQLATGQEIPIPELQDCPVFILSGGTSFISMPIQVGDPCLVIFNDRDIDTWWATAGPGLPATPRMHSFSDAFVLVGVRPKPSALAVNDQALTINAGLNKVLIQNQITDLKTLVDQLIQILSTLTVTVAGSSGTVSPATVSQLTILQTQFDQLLSEVIP